MNQNSQQKSALENLVAETERLRENLHEVRREKDDAIRNLRKAEAEAKTYDIKIRTIEAERQRDLAQNRRLMESLEGERKERVRLLTELSEVKNQLTRIDPELCSLRSRAADMESENNRLIKQLEQMSIQHVTAVRDRQTALNSVRVLETKMEASANETKFLNSKVSQLDSELQRVRKEHAELSKKYNEKELGVQAIYRDEQTTKQKLLTEFQSKISDKDEQLKNEIQRYLDENSQLKQRIIQLQGVL